MKGEGPALIPVRVSARYIYRANNDCECDNNSNKSMEIRLQHCPET